MAQMFRAVKCDSKRSQSDWQEEYANRKRARIEEERKVSQKQASSGFFKYILGRLGYFYKKFIHNNRKRAGASVIDC